MTKEQPQVSAESKAKVQEAWNKVASIDAEIKKTEQTYKTLVLIGQLEAATVALWKVIADVTSEINPTLKRDITRDQTGYQRLTDSDICWMDKCWEIQRKTGRCNHCGKQHYFDD